MPPEQPTSTSTSTPANRARPPTRPTAQKPDPAQLAKSLKRANSDDVVEVPNPNAQQSSRPAAPPAAAQPTAARPQSKSTPQPTPEQLLQAAQQKLQLIMKQETGRIKSEVFPEISMDQETARNMKAKLQSLVQPLMAAGKFLTRWFLVTQDEERVRSYSRTVSFRADLEIKY